jgi:hypothetical protein
MLALPLESADSTRKRMPISPTWIVSFEPELILGRTLLRRRKSSGSADTIRS